MIFVLSLMILVCGVPCLEMGILRNVRIISCSLFVVARAEVHKVWYEELIKYPALRWGGGLDT